MARKAKQVASALIDLYLCRHQPFILTLQAFRTIADTEKMRTRFLQDVDERLRKRGYVLLDLHKELQLIGVEHVDHIAQWGLPPLPEASEAPSTPPQPAGADDDV
jgi:hypothetical protein